jgi:hypothetical protein
LEFALWRSNYGYIGHLDIEFEWFLKGVHEKEVLSNRNNQEIEFGKPERNIQVIDYSSEVLKRIG